MMDKVADCAPSGLLEIDKIKVHKVKFDDQVKMLDLMQKDKFLFLKTLKKKKWFTVKQCEKHTGNFTNTGKLFGIHISNA